MLNKTELRYLNHGKIYKIVCNVTGDVYYGSTTQSLKERLRMHNKDYKRYLNGNYHYVTSFKIIENGNYNIHLVENYRCMNRKQLESIERIYIEGYTCINKNIPTRTTREYIKEYHKNNKDKKKAYDKKYYENNKHKIKEYSKEYYENNKHKLNERKRQKFNCVCDGKYTYTTKSRHMKSIKHIKYYKN